MCLCSGREAGGAWESRSAGFQAWLYVTGIFEASLQTYLQECLQLDAVTNKLRNTEGKRPMGCPLMTSLLGL